MTLEEELLKIDTEPEMVVAEKLAELDGIIAGLPDRKPTNPGNKTMKEHLQKMRDKIEQNPDIFLKEQKIRIERAIEEDEVLE